MACPKVLAKVVAFDEAGQLKNWISTEGGPGPCQDRLIVLCESFWVSSLRSPPLEVW